MTRHDNLPYSAHHQDRRVLDVFLPDAPHGAAIFFVHGGGWKGGAKESWHPVMEHFCGLGYVCATAEYRLSPEATLAGMVEDLRLALAFMKQHSDEWGFDPGRVAAYGSSAGGHLVGMLATIRPEDDLGAGGTPAPRDTVPQAVVAINPALSLARLDQQWVPAEMLADWPAGAGSPSPEERLGGRGTLRQAQGLPASPRPTVPPFIVVVGDRDEITPLAMQEAAVAALQAHGVPVELVVIPGAPHGAFYGVTSEYQQLALPHIEGFLAKALRVT
jgi:acetyl esterase/lipase